MQLHTIRLLEGQDLRRSIIDFVVAKGLQSAGISRMTASSIRL